MKSVEITRVVIYRPIALRDTQSTVIVLKHKQMAIGYDSKHCAGAVESDNICVHISFRDFANSQDLYS